MTIQAAMSELKKYGAAKNVKLYRKHGAKGELYGVSFANLNKLKKNIKVDHELAVELWDTGNVDARTLATMIADPELLTTSEADRWVKEIDYCLLGDVFSRLVAGSRSASVRTGKWMKSKQEYVRQCGYSVLVSALKNGNDISSGDCKKILAIIEKEIHNSPNRARHAMNNALIAIGIYRRSLTDLALAAAERIGRVEVDHGDTSCQTPDAVTYIRKSLARQK